MGADPAGVGGQLLGAGRRGGGLERGAPVEAGGPAERLQHGLSDPAVALGREVEPVLGPEPAVVEAGRGVQVDHRDARVLGELVDEVLHPQDRGEQPGRAGHPAGGVGAAEHDHGGAGGAQPGGGGAEEFLDPGDVAARAQHVVEPAGQGDQFGAQAGGPLDLLVVDLADELAPDGEVGVPEAVGRVFGRMFGRQPGGEAVGPAPVVAVGQQVVAHALGEGVPDGDVTAKGGGRVLRVLHGPRIVRAPSRTHPATPPARLPRPLARIGDDSTPSASGCRSRVDRWRAEWGTSGGTAGGRNRGPCAPRRPASGVSDTGATLPTAGRGRGASHTGAPATGHPTATGHPHHGPRLGEPQPAATAPERSAAPTGPAVTAPPVTQCVRTASVGRCSPSASSPQPPSASTTGRSAAPRPVNS